MAEQEDHKVCFTMLTRFGRRRLSPRLNPFVSTRHRINVSFQFSTESRSAKDVGIFRAANDSDSYKVAQVTMDGQITVKNVETAEILKGSSIYARDLFALSLTSKQDRRQQRLRRGIPQSTTSVILPRGKVILLSFGNVRALVSSDSVMVFDAHNIIMKDFAKDMSEVFQAESATEAQDTERGGGYNDQPFELVFLEHVLQYNCDAYRRRIRLFEPIVDSFLDRVAHEVFSDSGVHLLVPLKDSLQSFEMQVRQALDCLTGLLQDDEDMLALLITEQERALANDTEVDPTRHQDVELLLEEYARQINNILFEINYLLKRLQSKQEFVQLALAGYRNRLIRMNLYLGVAGLSTGIGTAVAGFYGMNLINGLETEPMAFNYVVGVCGLAGAFVAGGCASFVSGKTMQKRAQTRLTEVETLTNALSDMSALDYTVKNMVDSNAQLTKEMFREQLKKARVSGNVSEGEVSLLFEVMDKQSDGILSDMDFKSLRELQAVKKESRPLPTSEG